MTSEQKEILLKDLCARLPYGVKGRVSSRDCNNRESEFVTTIDGKLYDRFAVAQESWYDNVTIKPYLFPLSSMTEEQKIECFKGTPLEIDKYGCIAVKDDFYGNSYYTDLDIYLEVINWLNKNHFDYSGLIPMGIATDATGLNIYTNSNE